MSNTDQQAMLASPSPSPQLILHAIAHPLRRKILGWLKDAIRYFPQQAYGREFGVCAGQIALRCGLAQSTVSQHLSLLKKAELIEEHRVGSVHFFTRNEVTLQRFTHQLADLLAHPLRAANHQTD
ncbi:MULTISPECIES: ArsR/SmtB family transcription factor [unclassified Pseudomonas]|jgi:ArsR family transcriptional regulator|uniref:ArsR/SmtB family transcription factor n=1 Tax=unclassified Pseudomonas TaxID=196821 RepID=UPI0002700DEC|nr:MULTISPECIES: helix-turn-helix transcriptional regulator [unclassified Pseudomonas]EJM06415.1 putative transcriptional regulator [Pseudomonas sp. GM16]EJM44312.1 putative transcriptional regulator [Pseudomonas sp. GM24]